MSILESIFYMIWRGIAIGILISAPMGPVGILCIQRTLDKGRRTGLFTGIGAAISDLFYCLLTGFGLSFIEDFLERNHSIIQLSGSIVLIAFSIYLFRKNPAKSLRTPSETGGSAQRDIFYGFLFTVSNPLIIFLIIGLFARFNFLMPEFHIYHYLIGFIFILVGALFWWWFVTFAINKVRAHFNMRSMFVINKIIGSIILLFALVGIVSSIIDLTSQQAKAKSIYLNRARGYAPFNQWNKDGILLVPSDSDNKSEEGVLPLQTNLRDFSIQCRGASSDSWGLRLFGSNNEIIELTFKRKESKHIISSKSIIELSACFSDNSSSSLPTNQPVIVSINSGVDTSGQPNTLFLSQKIIDNSAYYNIRFGNRSLSDILSFQTKAFSIDSISFFAPGNKKAVVSDIIIHIDDDFSAPYCEETDIEYLLKAATSSKNSLEGIWKMLDSSFDTSLMQQGGDYKIATIKNNDGYAIIYLDGAQINPTKWRPGMIKGFIKPTELKNVYDIEWIDADNVRIKKGIKMQQENNDILSLQFPYQNSNVRFQRISSFNPDNESYDSNF